MKIAFALYDYYPFGGLQADCLATAVATQKRGHEVHIFSRTWEGPLPGELQIHTLGKRGWSNTSRNEHFFKSLERELPKLEFDGLVAFNRIPHADIYFAADPCFVEKKKALPAYKKLGWRYRYYAGLEARIFNGENAPKTLVLTDKETVAFHKHYGVPESYFHRLPPGVERVERSEEARLTNRKRVREDLGTPGDTTIALFVGSGFRIKGLDRALRAIAANTSQPLEFWILGKGKQAAYQRLADECTATVRFLGGRADVARFYDAADFLLHPAYSESAGKVLLEAVTHRLPVITTASCGYAFHITNAEAGQVLAEPFSQEHLNEVVRQFVADPTMLEAMGEHACSYAENHDLYSCHTSAAELIERLLRDPKGTD